MTQPLPGRSPLARQLEDQPDKRIPWVVFAVEADITGMYGQPSPGLMARAKRGWRNLGALRARIDPADEDTAAEGGRG
ncbi:hypothetical protein [Streptomyces sp. NPDC001502]|uniref:hypothetical protein n=1 Tax=Streptomyces sp. NPDC001502 TaxID=3364578 RepID=UPI00367620B6